MILLMEEVEELEESLPSVPPDTCPLIDKAIRSIEAAMRLCNSRGAIRYRYDPETKEELASAVETELDGVVDLLEQIRGHNTTLRELGREWHVFAKRYAEEVRGE